ncbi:4567_t:CDS:10 [Ambispora leptoticha]|uniref:4567_t:CDS:1 n=1 Tax=Ambispora leptoticha TaxID=144679 RepID=A0A9N8VVF3_9GLOM|nr:4567_t:CDS:10 [Ambispora leptoticha]
MKSIQKNHIEIDKKLYVGPVTSLCFHNDKVLLAGHGPYLKAFYVPTGDLLDSLLALEDWILDVQWLYDSIAEQIDERISEKNPLSSSSSSTSIKKETPKEIAIAFAHNFIEIWDHTSSTCLYSVECQEHCILYSARFFGDTRENLVLASGTVFNQVHLWNVMCRDKDGYGVVYKKLVGHEGVIFGIRFNKDGTSVVSVSDDRTIRVWRTDLDDNMKPRVLFGHMARIWDCLIFDDYLISISEDTTCRVWRNRFDDKDEDDDVDCLACWEGHVGKNVWSVAVNPSKKIVATGGQDSGIRLWSLSSVTKNKIDSENDLIKVELPPIEQYIQPLARNSDHKLPHTHEHARNCVIVDYSTIVMASNYGYIIRFNYQKNEWRTLFHDPELASYNMMTSSQCGRVVCCGSIYGQLIVLSVTNEFEVFEIFIEETNDPNVLYIISHAVHNDIYLLALDLNNITKPTLEILYKISVPPCFLLLSVAFSARYNLLFCGSRESELAIYHLSRSPSPFTKSDRDGKSFLVSDKDNSNDNDNHENSHNISTILYLSKTHGKQAITSIALKIGDELTPQKQEDTLYVFTTGRDGGYIKYRLKDLSALLSQPQQQKKASERADSLGLEINKSENNDDTKKSGETLDHDYDDNSDEYEETSKINEKSKIFSASSLKEENVERALSMEQVYRAKITKGWLEKVVFVDNELLLLGFYRKRFFVYNEEKKFEMFSVACGGAHRVWHFRAADKRMDKSTFVFIRKEKIYVYSRQASASSEGFDECKLQNNYHGREARALEYLPYPIKLFEGGKEIAKKNLISPVIFATGGEDSLLRLFQYIPGEKELRNLCSIKKHASAIRSIQWSQGIEKVLLLFSCGASEELRCWKVEMSLAKSEQLSNRQEFLKMVSEPVCINCLEWSRCPTISEIPETRIMDISVFPINFQHRHQNTSGLHFVAAVYSDSVLRIWIFDETTRHFYLLGDATFHNKCILQVKHLVIGDQQSKKEEEENNECENSVEEEWRIILFTCATDGRIAIWDVSKSVQNFLNTFSQSTKNPLSSYSFNDLISKLLQYKKPLDQPTMVYKAHQSGVNCMEVRSVGRDKFIVITGGDDNAVAVAMLYTSRRGNDLVVMDVYNMLDAHPSSIQGVHIINDTTFVTSSLDQRLNVWKLVKKKITPDSKEKDYAFKLVASEFVNVRDPSAMGATQYVSISSDKDQAHKGEVIASKTQIAVTGIGIELFEIRV